MLQWGIYEGDAFSEELYSGSSFLDGFVETDRGGEWGSYVWELQPGTLSADDRDVFYNELTVNRSNAALLSGQYSTVINNPSAIDSRRKTRDAGHASTTPLGQCMLTDNSGFSRNTIGAAERAAEYLIPQYLEISSGFGFISVNVGVSRLVQTQSADWGVIRGLPYMRPVAKDIPVSALFGEDLTALLESPFGSPPVAMVGDYSVGVGAAPVDGLQAHVAHHPSRGPALLTPLLRRAWYAHKERNAPDSSWTRLATGRANGVIDGIPAGYIFDAASGGAYQSFTPKPQTFPSGTVASCCVHALDFSVNHKAALWAIVDNFTEDAFPLASWPAALWAYDPEAGWVKVTDIDLDKSGGSVEFDGAYYQGYGRLIDETLARPILTNALADYHLALAVQAGSIGDLFLDRAGGLMWCGMSSRDFLNGQFSQMPRREPLYSLARKVTAT